MYEITHIYQDYAKKNSIALNDFEYDDELDRNYVYYDCSLKNKTLIFYETGYGTIYPESRLIKVPRHIPRFFHEPIIRFVFYCM